MGSSISLIGSPIPHMGSPSCFIREPLREMGARSGQTRARLPQLHVAFAGLHCPIPLHDAPCV
jgi:hypothetical protein